MSFGEGLLLDHTDVEGYMLPLAARVGEAEICVFNVIVLNKLQDILGGGHRLSSPFLGVRALRRSCSLTVALYRIQARFPGADANGFLYLGDENLSIANATRLSRAPDRVHGLIDHLVAQHDLNFYLW